jgi:hypothetical protein
MFIIPGIEHMEVTILQHLLFIKNFVTLVLINQPTRMALISLAVSPIVQSFLDGNVVLLALVLMPDQVAHKHVEMVYLILVKNVILVMPNLLQSK